MRSLMLALGCWVMLPALEAQGNSENSLRLQKPIALGLDPQHSQPPVDPFVDPRIDGQLEDAELGQIKLRPQPIARPEALPPENAPRFLPVKNSEVKSSEVKSSEVKNSEVKNSAIETPTALPLPPLDLSPRQQADRSLPKPAIDPPQDSLQAPVNPTLEADDTQLLIPDNDPELGTIQTRPPATDELGKILIRPKPKPPAAAKSKSVYLLARADYFNTANAFSARDRVPDGLVRTGLTLFYAPALGPSTYLITSADANVARYLKLSQLNYNELRFRVGISQRLSPVMFGELGWSNQQLFATERGFSGAFRGDRYLNDNSLRFELSRRDKLSPKLNLLTFYQLRRSFTDRSDNDRLSNTLYASLAYKATPKVEVALDYQYNRSDYIARDRRDHFHQVLGRLAWNTTKQLQTNLFAGYSFGASSDDRRLFGQLGRDRIDFRGWTLGVSLVLNTPLF